MGFRFFDLTVSDLRDAPAAPIKAPSDGMLMLKYIPRTGAWSEAELRQVTFTPAADLDRTIERQQTGVGTVRFHHAAWSDLPTMYHVVNALAELPVTESRGGSLILSRGGKSLRDQRVLI
jgi:hypothetical protein